MQWGGGVGVGVFSSGYFSVTKMYNPTLLALEWGGGAGKFPEKVLHDT